MTRYSKTMSEALEEVREASARADAKRAMSKDKDMKQNPFSKDDDASDDDVKSASKNIIMQLRKSVTMNGRHDVEFASGKKKVDKRMAQAAMDKFMRIKRSDDKLKFQQKLAKSYKDFLLALKEQYEMVEVKEDYVCEDCGCPQGNADPNCSCPNDSTDLQASYWVKKESVDEEFELDEKAKYTGKLMKNKSIVDYVKKQQEKNRKDVAKFGNKKVGAYGNEPRFDSGSDWLDMTADEVKLSSMSLNKRKAFDPEAEYEAIARKLGLDKFEPKLEEVELPLYVELEEGMKMNDPKLLKMFDKLKKGSKIKLKTSSTISQGKDYVEYIVKSKNTVNKGRVEKITLATVGNEKAVKKFLYKRDGTVGFAIGDMGASIDDIKEGTWAVPSSSKAKAELKKLMSKPIKLGKEGDDASDTMYSLIGDDELFDDLYVAGKKNPNGDARPIIKKAMKRLGIKEDFTPHMMYDPKTGKGYKADKEADHLRMKDMGYTHEKPDVKEAKFSDDMINKLKKAYEPMKGKKINPTPLMKIFDKIDSNKDGLEQLYKADIPFVSMMAMSRLMLKHNYKADQINKLGKISREDFVMDEAVISPQYKEGMKAAKDKKPYDSNPYKSGKKKLDWAKGHNEFRAKKLNAQNEEVELDEKYDLYHKSFSDAMSHAYDYAKKKLGITVDPKEIDNKVATGPKKPSDGKTNTYRLKGKGGNLQIQVYNKGGSKPFELNMYKEEVELDEGVPYKFAAVDKKGLVIGFASNERDAKDMAKRNKGRVVTLTKPLPDNKKSDMMINRPFPDKMDKFPTNTSATQGKRMGEENEKKPDNRPDSAKEVEQGRDDKKKTRIAQLQLQIAKATETINKLNTQEKQ